VTPRLRGWVDEHADRITADLLDWLRIPAISALPKHAGDVRRSAERCAALLRAAGLEHVEILETGGHPAVYGDWLHAGDDAPTALVYGHHDVQPVDPLELWHHPPFEPLIAEGEHGPECRARGSIDDKGQVLYEIEAVRGLLATEGRLPVNVRFLVEGEEEVGSPNFEPLLERERARFACDVVVVSDTGMWSVDVPSTCVGMRGLVAFDVQVRTAGGDLHSGVYGGAVPNAAHVVAGIVGALHDGDGRVTIPGFYDRVRPLGPAEEASLAALPFDEESWKAEAGVRRLDGVRGWSTLARVGYRPTAEVVGIHAGYAGDGIKTIVPATGGCKVTFRLVADQEPSEVAAAFRAWLDARVPEGVDVAVTEIGGVAPALTPVDHPSVGALGRAIETVWGTGPLFTREGGSGPEEALGRVLAAPVLFLGVGLPGDRLHAPNERMVMGQFWKGLLAAGELWHELAAASR
jgi:acetylornithine deacetylase/succinyl-diaminopimelate desuccinylase-like protein